MAKFAFILGTRPEITKLYPCISYCIQNQVDHVTISTDQHYDARMRDIFFDELGLPQPTHQLGIGSASHARMLAQMLVALEDVLLKEKPDVVIVQGDTNTVLAGALVASKLRIKIAHVEAGLRSYDRDMPEEYNRVITDHCSDFLFAPTAKQAKILAAEGIPPASIYVTGNTIVDTVLELAERAPKPDNKEPFLLLTCHRPSNTDNPEHFHAILSAIQEICEREGLTCIFPMHPRLNAQLDLIRSFDRIKSSEPIGYTRMLSYLKNAEMILTDSGGIQEEACTLEKKCLILRTNTERPETLEVGGALLLEKITKGEILRQYDALNNTKVKWYNPFGDGHSGSRIIKILTEELH